MVEDEFVKVEPRPAIRNVELNECKGWKNEPNLVFSMR